MLDGVEVVLVLVVAGVVGGSALDLFVQFLFQLLVVLFCAPDVPVLSRIHGLPGHLCLAENRSLKETEKQPPENVVANKAVCELLGLKAGAAAEDVTAKIMELKSGTVDGVNLAEELKALKQQNAEREANDAVILALKAGKITPAQKEWAKSYALSDPKGFGSFVEKAPQIVPMDKIELDDVKALKSDALDADTLLVCKQLGISPDDVKKYGMKED